MSKGQRSHTGFVLQFLLGNGPGGTGKGFGMKINKFLTTGWWRCRGGDKSDCEIPNPLGYRYILGAGSGFMAAGTEEMRCRRKI